MKRHAQKAAGALAILFASAFIPSANADLFSVTDVNADPHIFECDLTAVEKDVTIAGSGVHVFTYKDESAAAVPASAGIPIQVIKVAVGDFIICRFKNNLSTESASIHWHGIELDNDSDGTAVTQDAILPGQSYTYRFQTFRPGLFWFHSHMLPGNTLFGGMYGVIIIENHIEASLKSTTLPADADTYTLALSDIEFDPATGKIAKLFKGAWKTENELVELCHQWTTDGAAGGGDKDACSASSNAGSTVLVNGQKPDSGAQTPKFNVPSGKKIRLRLLNESISRHFRLKLLNSGDNNIYRIGGQGGLLDNVILEGGTKGTWDSGYDQGEIVIGSGMRADTIIVPSGNEGDIIQLVGNPLAGTFSLSHLFPANYPIAYFQISGTSADTPPSPGDPILAGTVEDIENIKTGQTITPLQDPAPFSGSSDETIRLTTKTTGFYDSNPSIDEFAAPLDTNLGNGDFLVVPRPLTARYAHVGDVLELTVRNNTSAVHPYHLHGFSMQPLRFVKNSDGSTLYNFDYDEFLDTIDVYGGESYVFRVRLDDRAMFCDQSPSFPPGPVLAACGESQCGGAVGRWLFHCHILTHGALGMMGELTVLPTVDKPPVITCPADITQDTDPGKCTAVVTFEATATDDCGEPTIRCTPASGSTFSKGATTVTCTATDKAGQTSSCSFNVTVQDNERPQLSSSITVPIFWAPNHDLVNVGLSASATDNCPGSVIAVVVYGDEDDERPTGDGTYSPDAKNIGVGTLRLRAERNQVGDGRVYLIVVTATDTSGNKTVGCQTVVVPKDQTKRSLASVTAQAAAARAFCEGTGGAKPPGYFVIGDGLVIGPKQ